MSRKYYNITETKCGTERVCIADIPVGRRGQADLIACALNRLATDSGAETTYGVRLVEDESEHTWKNRPSGFTCVTCERDIPECEIDDSDPCKAMQCKACWYGLER